MGILQPVIKNCLEILHLAVFPASSINGTAHHMRHLERVLFRLLAG